jgi:hypothetical protein
VPAVAYFLLRSHTNTAERRRKCEGSYFSIHKPYV